MAAEGWGLVLQGDVLTSDYMGFLNVSASTTVPYAASQCSSVYMIAVDYRICCTT